LRASPMPMIWRAAAKACSMPHRDASRATRSFRGGIQIGGDQREPIAPVVRPRVRRLSSRTE
jgi:hypothetical protein